MGRGGESSAVDSIINIQPSAHQLPSMDSLPLPGGTHGGSDVPLTHSHNGADGIGGASHDFMSTMASAAAMVHMAGLYDSSSFGFKQEGRHPSLPGKTSMGNA